ncbi:hypothetical protein NM688_g8737 [Phlebia brevispora]|uniref:Uncharacterized protein n=1 Tax=Phlebia brevispora TaxID=194682 RepID=A0ACC1RR50_9APHY|nr:hypothetical protein NM688_g8737 [Phlebia brevispora]
MPPLRQSRLRGLLTPNSAAPAPRCQQSRTPNPAPALHSSLLFSSESAPSNHVCYIVKLLPDAMTQA